MSLLGDGRAGTDLLPAPATLPGEEVSRDLDQELLDLLCEDAEWVEETFQEIVATSEDPPSRSGASPLAARPRRQPPVPSGRRLPAERAEGQWSPAPYCRQRSPPSEHEHGADGGRQQPQREPRAERLALMDQQADRHGDHPERA
jgi:hypothetical protein